ncbi:MAG: hypothetical protein CL672_05740 [Balneola sp.]|nr:hypothetical protein [Balneola sp.]
MNYPIFLSIVNAIQSDVENKKIQTESFKTWQDNTIFATGLELNIKLEVSTRYLQKLSINFDWDKYREFKLANQLNGLDSHPLLGINELQNAKTKPNIDVELMLSFKPDHCQPKFKEGKGNYRMDFANQWMDLITRRIQVNYGPQFNITRWHVEIEGDDSGKYLSNIQLISYLQFDLSKTNDMQDLKCFVKKSLKSLLVRSSRVIKISESIIEQTINLAI